MFVVKRKVKKRLTDREKDSKIKLCVYQEIDRLVNEGKFELTPELTRKLIEGKLHRLEQQMQANRLIWSELYC